MNTSATTATGPAADIYSFLNCVPQHDSTTQPHNTWTVEPGHYQRTDGTDVHVQGQHGLNQSTEAPSATSSMECLPGGSR